MSEHCEYIEGGGLDAQLNRIVALEKDHANLGVSVQSRVPGLPMDQAMLNHIESVLERVAELDQDSSSLLRIDSNGEPIQRPEFD